MTAPNDWPPEAREAVARAIHAKRYTRLGCDVLPMDNDDARFCGALADAALAALAPWVAEIEETAFQRGAEAMREKIAVEHDAAAVRQDEGQPGPTTLTGGFLGAYERCWATATRALPIPEDKQP